MFYVYILYSVQHDKFYVGHTDDPFHRFLQHNELSDDGFTSKYRPWILVACSAPIPHRNTAVKIEKYIKNQKSKKFIRKLVDEKKLDGLISRFSSTPSQSDP
jgi:putative endonuclease